MKTILKALFVVTLTVFFFNQGFAQTTVKSGSDNTTTGTAVQGKMVDNNNNGVCDHHEGKGMDSKCAGFVDKDGNGSCDNCGKTADGCKMANCQGHQDGKGCGQGNAACSGKCQGQEKGKCCPNQQGTPAVTPSETPDPKK
jgi:hypothetical protein